MLGATMSFLGLYQYDNTIFDDMVLPSMVDRSTLIDNLLMETAEQEIIYPDPIFLKNALRIYSRRQIGTWEHLAETFDLEYNPIWNVDGSVVENENRDLKRTDKSARTESGNSNSSGSEETTRAGYNSASYGPDEKISSTGNSSASLKADEDRSGTDTGTIRRETIRTGNIGVTTTQQMLREELDIRPKLNIYHYIIEDLRSRFCLMVY